MSQRERQPVAGVALSPAAADRSAPATGHGIAGPDWETQFPTLLPIQQQSLLALASQQGCLRADQIPMGGDQPSDRARAFFTALLQDSAPDALAPFQAEAIRPIDLNLDPDQLAAVALAIQTPDLAMIRGLPGSGKSRVIAEIVRQAARLSRRVLVVAPSSIGLDVVLERIVDDACVVPLRCVSRDERVDQLPVHATNRTFASYRRQMAEEPIRHVRLAIQRSEAAIARWRVDLTLLDRMMPVAEQHQNLMNRRDLLNQTIARIAPELERATDGPFAQRLRERQVHHASVLDEKDRELAAALAQLHDLHKQVSDAEAKIKDAECSQADRGFLQRLLGLGATRVQTQLDETKAALAALLGQRERAGQTSRHIAGERDAAAREWDAERRGLIDEEVSRRRAEHELELAAMASEAGDIEQRWREMTRGLSPSCARVDVCAPPAVEQSRLAVRQFIERENQDVSFARRWCEYLASNAEALVARLQKCFNAVFALPSAIHSDERLADLIRSERFDLVVIDDAQQFSEAELQTILRRASRWVLVGERMPEHAAGESPARWNPNGRERRSSPRASMTNRLRAGFWPRLWQSLEHEVWSRAGDRLRCRLRPIAAAVRAQVETESVADSPDVELSILTPDSGPPALVEVSFPASTAIEHALEYLYRELNELPVPNRIPSWQDASGRLTARFANDPMKSSVELEPGLRLQLAKDGKTIGVEFDRAADWDRERAAGWLREHTRPVDSGRSIDLTVSHRMAAGVVQVVSQVWFENRFAVPAEDPRAAPQPVEFVRAPAAASLPGRHGESDSNGHRSRGASGFETDLSDARQRDHLTREFHSALPARGLVNLSEARAIVQLLEERLAEFAGQLAEKLGSIAILTLHAAQAELIRALVRESQALARPSIPLFVGHAAEFRQREADLVVVSLTRSNDRRTVSYSDDPSLVAAAVTRARISLILVGDPAMLARRARWDGPVDHQDEWAAELEKGWVAALLDRLNELQRPEVPLLEGSP